MQNRFGIDVTFLPGYPEVIILYISVLIAKKQKKKKKKKQQQQQQKTGMTCVPYTT